ncbi:hypothetical protein QE152_g36550 [Popillia japonica]|uniref:Uncharacterized protein n=1 Tax=Popillia japonica TaxID=7064 RepID=A0AAW1ID78_POPJA
MYATFLYNKKQPPTKANCKLDINIYKVEHADQGTTYGRKHHQDQYTQTSLRSQKCSACKVAQESIRSLTDELVKQNQGEYITQAKKYIQESIYEVTQVSSIDILTKAIRNDITNLVRNNQELQKQLEDQKRMYQYLNYSYKDGVKRNAELLLKIQELETLEQGHLESVSTLQSKLSQLNFEKFQMDRILSEEKGKCENLQKEINNYNEITTALRSDIENYQRKVDCLTKAVGDITSEKDVWKIRFTDAHSENKKLDALNAESKATVNKLEEDLKHARDNIEQLDSEIKQVCNESEKEIWRTRYINVQNENEQLQTLNNDLKNIINRLEHELDLAVSHFKELDGRIDRNYQEIDSNAKAYVELLKKTQEVVESSDKLVDQIENNSFVNNTGGNDFEVQGDPLYDMMKQVEINKINMDKLEKQNAMLMSTIRKVRRRK